MLEKLTSDRYFYPICLLLLAVILASTSMIVTGNEMRNCHANCNAAGYQGSMRARSGCYCMNEGGVQVPWSVVREEGE